MVTTQKTCKDCGQQFTIEYDPDALFARVLARVTEAVCICEKCGIAAKKIDEEREANERREHILKERIRAFEKLCPPEFRQPLDHRLPKAALPHVDSVVGWEFNPKGLLLMGQTARAKTRLVWQLLRRLYIDEKRSLSVFDSTRSFDLLCADAFLNGTARQWVEEQCAVDVLFLDDIEKMKFTERPEVELFRIIDHRSKWWLPTIITTNATGAGLEAKMTENRGAPLVRRLREFCTIINFDTAEVA